jgi:hypothetical protein
VLRRGADVDGLAATGIFAHAARAKVVVLQAVAVPKRQPDFAIPDLAMGMAMPECLEGNPAQRAPGAAAFALSQFHFLALLAPGRLFGGNGLNRLRIQPQSFPRAAIGVLL